MKDKTTAGLLAIFGGWLGLHRFYLGQPVLGIIYLVLMVTFIPVLLGLIDGISLLAMSEENFDRRYNRSARQSRRQPRRRPSRAPRRNERANQRRQTRQPSRAQRGASAPRRTANRKNPFFDTGMKKYEDYDMEGAIQDFEKALEIGGSDPKVHFRLACAYSLIENKDKGFYHLSRSVETGLKNLDKIQSTDELAYLRIQDEFDDFKKNNFRLSPTVQAPPQVEGLDEDILLRQLNKLKDLREKGILSEAEFAQEKRKLIRR